MEVLHELPLLVKAAILGIVEAFFNALACVHWPIRFVANHGFVVFAGYRIVFGGIVLPTARSGLVEWPS